MFITAVFDLEIPRKLGQGKVKMVTFLLKQGKKGTGRVKVGLFLLQYIDSSIVYLAMVSLHIQSLLVHYSNSSSHSCLQQKPKLKFWLWYAST